MSVHRAVANASEATTAACRRSWSSSVLKRVMSSSVRSLTPGTPGDGKRFTAYSRSGRRQGAIMKGNLKFQTAGGQLVPFIEQRTARPRRRRREQPLEPALARAAPATRPLAARRRKHHGRPGYPQVYHRQLSRRARHHLGHHRDRRTHERRQIDALQPTDCAKRSQGGGEPCAGHDPGEPTGIRRTVQRRRHTRRRRGRRSRPGRAGLCL